MLYWYLLFFFVAVGAKLVLALTMMYLLLPSDPGCSRCDGDTLQVRPRRAGRLLLRALLGRVQLRWCPRCGAEALARRPPAAARPAGVRFHVPQPIRHQQPDRRRS